MIEVYKNREEGTIILSSKMRTLSLSNLNGNNGIFDGWWHWSHFDRLEGDILIDITEYSNVRMFRVCDSLIIFIHKSNDDLIKFKIESDGSIHYMMKTKVGFKGFKKIESENEILKLEIRRI